jgi:hypothetical protein
LRRTFLLCAFYPLGQGWMSQVNEFFVWKKRKSGETRGIAAW